MSDDLTLNIESDIRLIESVTPYSVELGFMDTFIRVGLITPGDDECIDDILGGPFETRKEVAAFLAGLQEFAPLFQLVDQLRDELRALKAEKMATFDAENNR